MREVVGTVFQVYQAGVHSREDPHHPYLIDTFATKEGAEKRITRLLANSGPGVYYWTVEREVWSE